MKTPRTTTAILVMGILGLSMLMVFAPSATAQSLIPCATADVMPATVRFISADDPGRMVPWQPQTITARFEYKAEQQSFSLRPIPVTITAGASQSWVQVEPAQFTDFVTPQPNDDSATNIQMQVSVQLTDRAPIGEQARVDFTITAGAGDCVGQPESVTQGATLTAGYFEQFNVRFDRTMPKSGQNAVLTIPLVVTNLGNADIEVRATPHEDSSKELGAPRIPAITVASPLAGGDSQQTFNIEIRTPYKNGYMNQFDEYILLVTAVPVQQPNFPDATTYELSAQIQTQGVFVPGFDSVLVLLSMLGVALLAWRRR